VALGRVDGFGDDEGQGEGDEGAVMLGCFLAAQGDAFEALEPADHLLDAGAASVEDFREEGRAVHGRDLVGDGGADAAGAGGLPVGLGVVALVAEGGAGRDVGADVEKGLEVAAVAGFSARQMEGERAAIEVGLEMDLGREAAARAAERLILLPPFAPAADTCARTTVESNICTRWAVPLIAASASNMASNTPARLRRQNRFQTLFQGPNCAGSARQVML
jgi:hypothetical protein